MMYYVALAGYCIGILGMCLSGIWFLIATFRVGLLWGLACFFIPLFQILFLFFHWHKAAKPFFIGLFSFLLMSTSFLVCHRNANDSQIKQWRRFYQFLAERAGNAAWTEKILRSANDFTKSIQNKIESSPTEAITGQPKKASQDLIAAVRAGKLAAVQNRVEAGEDLNVRSESGETPVMEASAYGYEEIVRYLAAQGANLELKNKRGQTARDIAAENYREAIVAFLDQAQSTDSATEVAPANP